MAAEGDNVFEGVMVQASSRGADLYPGGGGGGGDGGRPRYVPG